MIKIINVRKLFWKSNHLSKHDFQKQIVKENNTASGFFLRSNLVENISPTLKKLKIIYLVGILSATINFFVFLLVS